MRELMLLLIVGPIVVLAVISQRFTELGSTVASQQAPTPVVVRIASTPGAPMPTVAPVGGAIEQAIQAAMTWLGVPYLWGGCSRHGVDCSCFVQNVMATIAVSVPRTTVTQVAFDRPISRGELRPGDTVFFNNTCSDCGPNPTHEGLYLGGGKMIDAGSPVQINDVFSGFYGARYAGAGRPPGL